MKTYIPNEENVKPLGRTALADNTLWLAFSGAGAAFTFKGTRAAVTFAGDSTAVPAAPKPETHTRPEQAAAGGKQDTAAQSEGEDVYCRIAVYVNGRRVVDDMMDAPRKEYVVWESREARECLVEIVKLSESAMSTVGILSIGAETEDGIHPAPLKPRYVEIVGDSITCGYGVDDACAEHHFSTKTEDVTKAYGYLAAKELNADYSMVCLSGYGLISGYVGEGEPKKPEQILSRYYDKLGFSYAEYRGRKPEEVIWEPVREAELVVINLGTNDDSYTQGIAEREEEYRRAYTAFLGQVRSRNPKAGILCTLGIMGGRLCPVLESAVEDYRKKTGDPAIFTMRFTEQLLEDGYVADYHPTEITHQKAAKQLADKIREVTGWKGCPAEAGQEKIISEN